MESIQVLFKFRNVIAHGREINAYEVIKRYGSYQEEFYKREEYFFGGYKEAENFLLKKKLIKRKFVETNNGNLLFTNTVANYFIKVSNKFENAIEKFINKNIDIDKYKYTKINKKNMK